MSAPHPGKYLWVDLETTGLDADHHHLLEVGAVITDNDLEAIDTFTTVVRPEPGYAETMDDYVTQMHTDNGLLDEIESGSGLPRDSADEVFSAWIRSHAEGQPLVLAGNSIFFDRTWMNRHLPLAASNLHYHSLDVRSLTLFFTRTATELDATADTFGIPESSPVHRSIGDIFASIHRARAYKRALNLGAYHAREAAPDTV